MKKYPTFAEQQKIPLPPKILEFQRKMQGLEKSITSDMMSGICKRLALGVSYRDIADYYQIKREEIAPAVKQYLDYEEQKRKPLRKG